MQWTNFVCTSPQSKFFLCDPVGSALSKSKHNTLSRNKQSLSNQYIGVCRDSRGNKDSKDKENKDRGKDNRGGKDNSFMDNHF
jgi:hypothetical protein